MAWIRTMQRRAEHYQRGHRWLAFPLAVVKKFGQDQAGNLAALIAYYGFFSLFPLLLVFVTVLGFVLHGDPGLQQRIVGSTLSQFPVIGSQIQRNVHSVQGNGFALGVGIVGSVWGGLGIAQIAQTALNRVWQVPMRRRPGFLPRIARSLLLLLVLGTGAVATTVLSGISTGEGRFGVPLRTVFVLASIAANVGLFTLAFRVLTAQDVAARDLFPGAVVAAVGWAALQFVGTYYVTRTLRHASEIYGTFGVVIGLLSWIYLSAQLVLYAAEINVVRARRLWPRSFFDDSEPTDADRRVDAASASQDTRLANASATVEVSFSAADHDDNR